MSTRVCLFANTLGYPEGGGHFWVYLNWALGFKSAGCDVVWMELAESEQTGAVAASVQMLRERLSPYGLDERICVLPATDEREAKASIPQVDLLFNMHYDLPESLVSRFPRSALLDIDPGLLQVWLSRGEIKLSRHDVYFTIGETVGTHQARFPSCGIQWHYTAPCVSLDHWPVIRAPAGAPFTTVTHWFADEWVEAETESYNNEKREGFLPFIDLPRMVSCPMELAVCLGDERDERALLERKGWRVRESSDVASRPWTYQQYIQHSFAEFSCAKPSCMKLGAAWISDRTACYLASGKPAVVQHTGPSRFLPDAHGLLRFRDLREAVSHVAMVMDDYPRQCRYARELAEEFFDARKAASRVLERALV